MRGIVTGFTDHGTIVTMHVEAADGAVENVQFDHRYFGYLLEHLSTQRETLLYREVEVLDNASGEGQTLTFDPDPVGADAEVDQVAPT